MALKCTNTSGPDSCEMKPNPFSALNHFTTPTGTTVPPATAPPLWRTLRAHRTSPGWRVGRAPRRFADPPLLVWRAVTLTREFRFDGSQQRPQPRLQARPGRRFAPSPPGQAQGLRLLPRLDPVGRLQGRQSSRT